MAKKQSGLGRDLYSLFDDNMVGESKKSAAEMLRISEIEPRMDQPRKDGKFNWNCTMKDMLEDCIKVALEQNPDRSAEEVRSELTAIFPTLKRWKKE